jgi:Glycosyltransferase 61
MVKQRTISINMPTNLNERNSCFFQNNICELPVLKAFEAEDIIVTHDGLCLKDQTIVSESIHAYRDEIEISRLSGLINTSTLETKHLSSSSYFLVIQGRIFSYYHWMTDSIPRLWMMREHLEDLILLLPESLSNIGYVNESLLPFKFRDIYYISEDFNIQVKKLIIPQSRLFYTHYYPEVINKIRGFYLEELKKTQPYPAADNSRKILLQNSLNENSIPSVLKESIVEICINNDFEPIDFSSYSFHEQISLMTQVQSIISYNMSDLTGILFMHPGSNVIEINRAPDNENDYYFERYWFLSSVLGLKYYHHIADYRLENMSTRFKGYSSQVFFNQQFQDIFPGLSE